MKKISLIFALFLPVIFASNVEAKKFKYWVNKTVWEDANGYVYSVGKAPYSHESTEEFLISQDLATKKAIRSLKNFLKVNRLIEFEVIGFEYSQTTYYVLASVPKYKNNPQTESNRIHPKQSILLVQNLSDDEKECIGKYRNQPIFACESPTGVGLYAVTTVVITEPGEIGKDKAYTIAKNKAKFMIKEHLDEQYLFSGELNDFHGIIVEFEKDTLTFIGGIPLEKNIDEGFWG